MKKKWTAGILTTALIAASMVPAYAAENPQSGETKLTATVGSDYTLTIPQNTDIAFNQTSTELNGVLKVSGNVAVGESVTVTAQTNPFHNEQQNADIPYTLKNGKELFQSAQWSEAELQEGLTGEGKELTLSIEITEADWEEAKAGSYEGSIVFRAQLNEAEK